MEEGIVDDMRVGSGLKKKKSRQAGFCLSLSLRVSHACEGTFGMEAIVHKSNGSTNAYSPIVLYTHTHTHTHSRAQASAAFDSHSLRPSGLGVPYRCCQSCRIAG